MERGFLFLTHWNRNTSLCYKKKIIHTTHILHILHLLGLLLLLAITAIQIVFNPSQFVPQLELYSQLQLSLWSDPIAFFVFLNHYSEY